MAAAAQRLFSTAAVVDSLATLSLDDTAQTAKLARLWLKTAWGDMTRPWQLLMPFLSVLRSPGSREMLDTLRIAGVPVTVLHGDRDYVVPMAAARDTARRTAGDLVVVKGGTHSWLLKDPESFPAIMGGLLQGRLGDAYEAALVDAGLDPAVATTADIEDAFYAPDAAVRAFTPAMAWPGPTAGPNHATTGSWSATRPPRAALQPDARFPDGGVEHLDGVVDGQPALGVGGDLEGAAGVAGHDGGGAGGGEVGHLAAAELGGRLGFEQVVEAGRPAADLPLRRLDDGERRGYRPAPTGLVPYRLGVGQVAGVVVGDGQRHRVAGAPAAPPRPAPR